jgi:hypothetical protein
MKTIIGTIIKKALIKEPFLFFYKNYVIIYIVKIKEIKKMMKKGEYPYPMLLLELLPENKEVFEKTLKHLHNRGWTFGKGGPISKYTPCKDDDRVYIYDDKTIRIGNLVSTRFCKPKLTIQVNEEKVDESLAGGFEWIKEIEKSVLKGVYMYGKASF